MATTQDKIEMQAQKYMNAKTERDRAELSMEESKRILGGLLKESGEDHVLVYWNEDKNIKVKPTISRQTKLDKERLAQTLKVEESEVNTDFILNMVDKDRLTYDQYQDHKFIERNHTVDIRLVKV